MPPPLNTQTVVAFVWDFDKTLAPGYMQAPLFAHFGVDGSQFWREVNGLVDFYQAQGLKVSKDTAYLGHILSYVRDGHFRGLTNGLLRQLGADIELAPGMPDFMSRTREFVAETMAFARHDIKVEHYIESYLQLTGLVRG